MRTATLTAPLRLTESIFLWPVKRLLFLQVALGSGSVLCHSDPPFIGFSVHCRCPKQLFGVAVALASVDGAILLDDG